MERHSIDSSMMISIGYDSSQSILEVVFTRGVTWHYYDFPEHMWHEFLNAESKGKYFHINIKEQFTPSGYRV